MVKFVKSFVMDESGASAAEYALILAVVGTAIAAGAITLSGAIGLAMSDTADCIEDPVANKAKC
jgi:pilus assembly protein Flp/PilA